LKKKKRRKRKRSGRLRKPSADVSRLWKTHSIETES